MKTEDWKCLVSLKGLVFVWMCDLLPDVSCIAILRCKLHVAAEAGATQGLARSGGWHG